MRSVKWLFAFAVNLCLFALGAAILIGGSAVFTILCTLAVSLFIIWAMTEVIIYKFTKETKEK